MSGVEVVDGQPIQMATDIILHLCHETTNEGFEVFEACPILGRYQKSKLIAITGGPAQKLIDIHIVAGRIVGSASAAVTADALPENVPEMEPGRIQVTGNACVPRRRD